jgi:protein arginine kinase activator
MAAPFKSCDHCERAAVVHNTFIVNGVMHEVHLCEEHANAAGIQVPGSPPVAKLLGEIAAASSNPPAKTKGPACPRCGMTYAEHRQSGVLGCADCYEAFASTLNVVLERAHGGSAQHVGKAPTRVGDWQQRAAVLQKMLRDLEEAVKAEQYERAAKLRDQIKTMRPGGSDAPGTPAPPVPRRASVPPGIPPSGPTRGGTA